MTIFFVNMTFEVEATSEESAEQAVNNLINWDNQPDDGARVESMVLLDIESTK